MLTREYMQRRIDQRDRIRLQHVKPFIDNKPPRTMDESVRLRKKKQDLDSINIIFYFIIYLIFYSILFQN